MADMIKQALNNQRVCNEFQNKVPLDTLSSFYSIARVKPIRPTPGSLTMKPSNGLSQPGQMRLCETGLLQRNSLPRSPSPKTSSAKEPNRP